MKQPWWRLAWFINRSTVRGAAWLVLLVGIAAGIHAAGVQILGGFEHWHAWIQAHAAHLLIWRICLYLAIGMGWWRIRPRLLGRNPHHRHRLQRAELAAVATIVLLEASQVLARG